MASSERPSARQPTVPIDLALVVGWAVIVGGVALSPVELPALFRAGAILPMLVFIPGYAVVAATFPATGDHPYSTPEAANVDALERVLLSVVSSLVLSILVGITLGYTVFGVELSPIVLTLTLISLVGAGVGAYRRSRLPAEVRFSFRPLGRSTRTTSFPSPAKSLTLANVFVVVAVLLTVGSVAYVSAVPQEGEQFTELGLLTQDDGELVAGSYPEELTAAGEETLVVSIENHEHRDVSYTLVVQFERVINQGAFLETAEVERVERTVPAGESTRISHTVSSAPLSGEELRLSYLLYIGEPPENPSTENAYREVHVWVDVPSTF
jgi:uncharacterized membrane protein